MSDEVKMVGCEQPTLRLPTGEEITLREHPWSNIVHRWEAVALVHDLPGEADRHGAGSTPEEAVKNLIDYVQALRGK